MRGELELDQAAKEEAEARSSFVVRHDDDDALFIRTNDLLVTHS